MNRLFSPKNLITFCLSTLLLTQYAAAELNSRTYAVTPVSLTEEHTPLVMLAMSNDEQLYYKAYSDFTDLDNDGALDTVYKDSFSYSGYFNPDLCYQYDATNQYFAVSDTKNTQTSFQHACVDSWSGNFLNWVSMTRMDLLRVTLYGGKRSIDDTELSASNREFGRAILERAYLPADAHSFAKVISQDSNALGFAGIALANLMPNAIVSASNASGTMQLNRQNQTLTFCNTTDTVSGKPILRVVNGSKPFWGAKEGQQCVFDGRAEAPESTSQIGSDFVVRVEVCADETDRTRCKEYVAAESGKSFFKPTGILQEYGETGEVHFGLITGSYHRNLDGGVLRKKVSRIAGGDDEGTVHEIDLQNGSFNTAVNGIIQTIDKFQIVNYGHNQAAGKSIYNDCQSFKISTESVKAASSYATACSNWGNPIAEIYYEALRYFAGNAAPLSEYANDVAWPVAGGGTDSISEYRIIQDNGPFTSSANGLNIETEWTSPFDESNYCTNCAIVILSSGIPSFDADIVSDLALENSKAEVPGLTATALNSATNLVGSTEYENLSTTPLIASNNGFCSEVELGSLKDVSGICPQNPSSEGSYHIAGLSYFSHVNDINSSWDGVQKIDTYAVELAESVPAMDFSIAGQRVTLVPACQSFNMGKDDYSYCSLNDVIVVDKVESETRVDGKSVKNLLYASMFVVWEDSQWGSDFDMDVVQRIDICSKDATTGLCGDATVGNDQFAIKQQIVLSAGSLGFRTSFSLSGTTSDGLQQGTNNSLWSTKIEHDGSSSGGGWDVNTGAPTIVANTYTVDRQSTAAELLVSPLYLAAKYGGFTEDENSSDNLPTLSSEWDSNNNAGVEGDVGTGSSASSGDGVPDNYYKVRNPALLGEQLSAAMDNIIERVSSGSNAAVVTNRASGNGAIYQAIYYPKESDADNNTVSWVGQLHSLFVDNAGLLREDSDGDGVLDDAPYFAENGSIVSGDYVVTIKYNEKRKNTFFQRFALMAGSGDQAKLARPVGVEQELKHLKTIWSAADKLASYSDQSLYLQRSYSTKADNGRHIFTSLPADCDLDENQNTTEVCMNSTDFVQTNVGSLGSLLGFSSSTEDTATAKATINFIRGIDSDGFRSRAINMDQDSDLETWRLGDIIHSTPLVVEKASEHYDLTLNDATYETFKTQYQNRRRMIYVGANDGLIHAFNGGFWNSVCNGFYTKLVEGSSQGGRIQGSDCANDATKSSLGSEMWAYAPYNLLPHLRWLTEPEYSHNFYVDGEPKSYDVRIFADDDTHPNGWGTILVVPMRQGGGKIAIDHDGSSQTADKIFQSAIVVLDITDPEQAPTVIAEITDENLGFTFTEPTLVVDYKPSAVVLDSNGNLVSGGDYSNPSESHWYLAFGSGPYPMDAGNAANTSSSQNAHLYAYDLKARKLTSSDVGTDVSQSFFTGFQARDWDGDGSTDTVYFGSVSGGASSSQNGKLLRWNITSGVDIDENLSPQILLNTTKPIVAKPITTRDINGDRWVHVGTGRYLTGDDRQTKVQQRVYGIKDSQPASTLASPVIATNTLFNSTGIKVLADSEIYSASGDQLQGEPGVAIANYDALVDFMTEKNGWFVDLTFSNNTDPSGRVLRSGLVYLDQLLFTEYVPSANQCDILGRSRLHVISWKTGTALPYDPLDSTTAQSLTDQTGTVDVINSSVDLGVGEFSSVTVFETSNNITLITDSSILDGLDNGNLSAEDYMSLSDGNCVFVQSSTGEMMCRRVSAGPVRSSGRQSWREVEILF